MTRADQVRALAARPCGVCISEVMSGCGIDAKRASSAIKIVRKSITQPHYLGKMPGYRPRLFASLEALQAWAAKCLPRLVIRAARERARSAAARPPKPPKIVKPPKPGPTLHDVGAQIKGARNNNGTLTTPHQATAGRQRPVAMPFSARPADYSRATYTVAPPYTHNTRYEVGPGEIVYGAGFSALPQGVYLADE